MPAPAAKFWSEVEPPEPMRGLVVPPELVDSLGDGKRPRVTVTINGHSWTTRVAIMRGRNLIGLSHANRRAAGVATGDTVEDALADLHGQQAGHIGASAPVKHVET